MLRATKGRLLRSCGVARTGQWITNFKIALQVQVQIEVKMFDFPKGGILSQSFWDFGSRANSEWTSYFLFHSTPFLMVTAKLLAATVGGGALLGVSSWVVCLSYSSVPVWFSWSRLGRRQPSPWSRPWLAGGGRVCMGINWGFLTSCFRDLFPCLRPPCLANVMVVAWRVDWETGGGRLSPSVI